VPRQDYRLHAAREPKIGRIAGTTARQCDLHGARRMKTPVLTSTSLQELQRRRRCKARTLGTLGPNRVRCTRRRRHRPGGFASWIRRSRRPVVSCMPSRVQDERRALLVGNWRPLRKGYCGIALV
jgi:hypothetical protein